MVEAFLWWLKFFKGRGILVDCDFLGGGGRGEADIFPGPNTIWASILANVVLTADNIDNIILDEEPQNKLNRNYYIECLSNINKHYILYIENCFTVIN